MKCEDCCHAEMCKWIDELEGRGCDFFDGEQEPTKREIEREYLFQSLCEDFKKLQAENDDLRKRLEQEPCEDAISREAAINIASLHCLTIDETVKALEQLPSVTQKSGKWHIAHGMYEDRFWCSCGYIRIMDSRMNEWKYCPVCGGAKMVEPQESEEISEHNMKMWEEIFKAERTDKE